MTRTARALCYLLPPLVCLAVFWRVPFIWFRIDDFAWLGLWQQTHSLSDLGWALFSPQAEGTIRTLSERIYFLTLGGLFGMYAAPFRAVALGTWFLDLALIQAIGTRLTGSRAAGLLAALLWTVNAVLTTPLMWASAYNQVLCALCMLAAFYARLRWLESRETKWRWAEAIAFLAGFGVLETIVVYPAIVLLHGWATRSTRAQWQSALWMLVPAGLFTAAHFLWIPKAPTPVYKLMVDSRLPWNLLQYAGWTLGPIDPDMWGPRWRVVSLAASWAIGVVLAEFTLRQTVREDRRALFCCGWFLLFLAPVLPLPNHVIAYYLTVPGIGLAWLGGWALASAARVKPSLRVAAVGLAVGLTCAYVVGSIADVKLITSWHLGITSRLRIMMRGVERTAAAYPGSALVLQGVDGELFRHSFNDDPFRLVGLHDVYLAPGSDEILDQGEFEGATRFHTTREALLPLLESGKARVLNVSENQVQDVTRVYGKVLGAEFLAAHRGVVEAGSKLFESRMGEGWYPIEGGARWTSKTATVTLAGPKTATEKLFVSGYAAAGALKSGPLVLRLAAGTRDLGSATLKDADKPFTLEFALPKELVGAYAMPITLQCARTFRPPNDPRDLGIVIQKFEVR